MAADYETKELLKELNLNLKMTTSALNNLTVQLSSLEAITTCANSLAPVGNASANAKEAQTRTWGYVNWNSSHDILKTEHWVKMTVFTDYCGLVERGQSYNRLGEHNKMHKAMKNKSVVDEKTRFPEATDAPDVYVNVSNPLVSAEISQIKNCTRTAPGLVERFMSVAKNDMHTFSSFEKKYELKWVEPFTGACKVTTAPVQEPMPLPRISSPAPVNDSLHEPAIPVSSSPRKEVKNEEVDSDTEPMTIKKENLTEDEIKTQEFGEKLTDILDKLTTQNLNISVKKVQNLEINNQKRLEMVSDLLLEKAIKEPHFSNVCAAMIQKLSLITVPSDNNPEQIVNFRGLVISKCQNQFETGKTDEQEKIEKELAETNDYVKKEELRVILDEENKKTRLRAVANVRLIGELYKKKMLTGKIMSHCINKLFETGGLSSQWHELDEDKLECLCQLLTTIAKEFENDTYGRYQLDDIFEKMQQIVNFKSNNISSRVKCKILNVIQLRAQNRAEERSGTEDKQQEEQQKKKKKKKRKRKEAWWLDFPNEDK